MPDVSDEILTYLDEKGGTATWTELSRLGIPSLHNHINILVGKGRLLRDDAEIDGKFVTSFVVARKRF